MFWDNNQQDLTVPGRLHTGQTPVNPGSNAFLVCQNSPYSNISSNTNPHDYAQVAIRHASDGGCLYLGNAYTHLVGTTSIIQSADYFSNIDHGENLLINPLGGNVGINCNSPQFQLDVNGITQIGGPGVLAIGNTSDLGGAGSVIKLRSDYFSNATYQIEYNNGVGAGADDLAVRFVGNSDAEAESQRYFSFGNYTSNNQSNTWNTSMVIGSQNGRVGINCNAPQYGLDVNGSGNFNGSVAIQNGNDFYFVNTTGWVYTFIANGTIAPSTFQLLMYDPGGEFQVQMLTVSPLYRIGILNNTPAYTLDVIGTIHASSNILAGGYIGIGNTSPGIPLHINSSVPHYLPTGAVVPAGQLFAEPPFAGAWGGATEPLSIYTAGDIWSATRVVVSSDERIKQDITPLALDSTLQLLQQITPVSYTYKDRAKSNKTQVGFIAQAVETICPNAISHSTEYIPNINTIVSTIVSTNNRITSYLEISSTLLSSSVQFYTPNNTKIQGTIVSISSNSFDTIVENTVEQYSTLLCHGTSVNDFRVLNKDYIYTLNVAATKKLMELVEQQGSTIQGIQQELRTLRA